MSPQQRDAFMRQQQMLARMSPQQRQQFMIQQQMMNNFSRMNDEQKQRLLAQVFHVHFSCYYLNTMVSYVWKYNMVI